MAGMQYWMSTQRTLNINIKINLKDQNFEGQVLVDLA